LELNIVRKFFFDLQEAGAPDGSLARGAGHVRRGPGRAAVPRRRPQELALHAGGRRAVLEEIESHVYGGGKAACTAGIGGFAECPRHWQRLTNTRHNILSSITTGKAYTTKN